MNLGDMLIVNAKKKGNIVLIKELESISNSSLQSKNKKEKVRSNKSVKDTNLCKSCGNYECINRRPYKTSCSSYVKCTTSRFKTFKGNHGNTGSGSRIFRFYSCFQRDVRLFMR